MDSIENVTSGIARQNLVIDAAKDAQEKLGQSKVLKEKELKKVGEEFESMFIRIVLDGMKETLDKKANPFYGGLSEDIFGDLLYQEYALLIANQNELGISEAIVRQYERQL